MSQWRVSVLRHGLTGGTVTGCDGAPEDPIGSSEAVDPRNRHHVTGHASLSCNQPNGARPVWTPFAVAAHSVAVTTPLIRLPA
jgi:hypothetical protein